MPRVSLLVALLWIGFGAGLTAQTQTLFAADWFSRPPTAQRVQAVYAAGVSKGWEAVAVNLFAGALRAYELRQDEAAIAWYQLARWSDLLRQSQSSVAQSWSDRISASGRWNENIEQRALQKLPDRPMAELLTGDTILWLLGNPAFSEAFFNQLSPDDCLPQVLTILQALRKADEKRFIVYQQLALAIALVYDMPPPPYWPHAQVSTKVLPRVLPAPVDAFSFLVDCDQEKQTLHKLSALPASDLRFAVDFAAGFPELVWSRHTMKFPLADWVKCYETVRYRDDRIESEEMSWTGKSYHLEDIYREGGICVDQAYFATQAGKARGVPTLLFGGAGQNGRHAWFGYLGPGERWVLDAGRYAEQKFVTGVAYDPQTWALMSDHELIFLSEGFRKLPAYRLSRLHQAFAEIYLNNGQAPAAAVAARKAVTIERRNADGWGLLLKASESATPQAREALLREAVQALQLFPDISAYFTHELAFSLRARGETSAASFAERLLVRREKARGRTDLGVSHATTVMDALPGDAPLTERLRVYRQLLQQYGREGGIDFYDRVAEPFVSKLAKQGSRGAAVQALNQTRAALAPEVDSQLDREIKKLAETLR